ncbi:hypothetical protein HO133_010730 [Letharia lupina]|uniref:LysM domain-containing protein n=1 Tax=Letharia lupina TaxID=560253 RepID=A0A8H6CJ47_9LECA|nr:uncharacterized protein HO133_010730 [Letharia lupina]KAF6224156.1 hypothetical protein HO133_010730 [Letharia lupina]
MHFSSIKQDTLVAHLVIIAAVFLQQINAINVQSGDTLARIAAEQGVSVAALEAANPGISANDLQPGEVLSVPAPNAVAKSPTLGATTLLKSTTATAPSSTPTSTRSSSSTPPPPPPPPPTTTTTPASPTTSIADITNIGLPSCAPSPIGKYSDASDVNSKTYAFCDNNGHLTLASLLAPPHNGLLSGDSQENNSDDGNGGPASNEKGFNMTISAIPQCAYPDSTETFTVGQPLGNSSQSDWWCEAVLTNCYNECE